MAKQRPVARKQSRSARDKQQKAEPGTGQNGREDEVARYEQDLAGYLQERIKPGLNRGAIPLLARSIAKEIAHRERVAVASEDAEAEDDYAEAEDESRAEEDVEPSAEEDEDYDADEDVEPGAEEDDEPSAEEDEDYDAEEDDEPGAEEDDEPSAEEDDEPSAEEDDEPSAEEDDEPSADEADESGAERKAPPDFEADMHELQEELGEDWILRFSVHGDAEWLTAEKEDGSQHLEAPTAAALLDAVDLLNQDGGRSS
jgi:hypothetical protein